MRWYRHGSTDERQRGGTTSTGPCAVAGCERSGPFVRGWCPHHYGAWRRHGDPMIAIDTTKPEVACAVVGCARVARSKGLCSGHYQALRAAGTTHAEDLNPQLRPHRSRYEGMSCQVEGCERSILNRGLCRKHYLKEWRANRKPT